MSTEEKGKIKSLEWLEMRLIVFGLQLLIFHIFKKKKKK